MTIPQRLTMVTIGARSVPKLREFYRAIGWSENEGSDETFTSFTIGTLRLALYPVELLGAEAAPNERVVAAGTWNGMTLTLNVAPRDAVDTALKTALAAGGSLIGGPIEREWADTRATSPIRKATTGRSLGRRGLPNPSSAAGRRVSSDLSMNALSAAVLC